MKKILLGYLTSIIVFSVFFIVYYMLMAKNFPGFHYYSYGILICLTIMYIVVRLFKLPLVNILIVLLFSLALFINTSKSLNYKYRFLLNDYYKTHDNLFGIFGYTTEQIEVYKLLKKTQQRRFIRPYFKITALDKSGLDFYDRIIYLLNNEKYVLIDKEVTTVYYFLDIKKSIENYYDIISSQENFKEIVEYKISDSGVLITVRTKQETDIRFLMIPKILEGDLLEFELRKG